MTRIYCPHCGGELVISKVASRPAPSRTGRGFAVFQSSHQTPLKSVATGSMPAPYESYTESPSFLPNRESHVTVPLLRSLITGVFAGLTAGIGVTYLCILGKGGIWFSLESGAMAGGVIFFGATIFEWIRVTGNYDRLLSRVETITGLDINQDGDIGQPEAPPLRVQVQEGQSLKFAELPGDRDALIEFAKKVNGGIVTFSEAGARRAGYGAAEFGRLRDVFIARHWAYWNHPTQRQQGVSLRGSGRAILKELSLPSQGVPGRESVGTVARGGTQHENNLGERFEHI